MKNKHVNFSCKTHINTLHGFINYTIIFKEKWKNLNDIFKDLPQNNRKVFVKYNLMLVYILRKCFVFKHNYGRQKSMCVWQKIETHLMRQ